MDKFEQLIMVVPAKTLFSSGYFQGFLAQENAADFEGRILKNFSYLKRGLAEKDVSFKQPIGYALIVNPRLKKVFAYKRAQSGAHYNESRLAGKWSWGVGGHVDKTEENSPNPISESLLREISEEITLPSIIGTRVLGYLNDDLTQVGKVHFGVLYLIETDSGQVKPSSSEISAGELKSITELEEILSSKDAAVEEWSKIALGPLKAFFSK
ncbi:NUDIX domain-containing protein [Candidatus Micrarchaeota archaeon]|nr:NUDIX domain-containing protein [Candidatus Micrarchaeota archaeon]